MDYHSLKRRDLQALCKEHNIPANSANSVLADKLSKLLNGKQKPNRQLTCMKRLIETTEGEPAALKSQAKKVRFSPSNDLIEYELRSGEKQKDMVTEIKARRKPMAKKAVELVDDSVQIPVKLTRSRVQLSGKDVVIPNNEKKQSRKEAKYVEKGTDLDKENEGNVGKVTRSKVHMLKIGGGVQHEESRQSKRLSKNVEKASESVEETAVSRARITRSKAQNLTEDGTGPDVNHHVKKKSGKQVETDGQNVEPCADFINIPVRATRSRRQMASEDVGNTVTNTKADKKRTKREMKATDLSSNASHVVSLDKQEPPKKKSLRTRGAYTINIDGGTVGVVNEGRVTRSKAPLAMKASRRSSKNKANEVEIQQIEEPSKHAGKKNVNRRKSVLPVEKTEVVLHCKDPLNLPAKRSTRRKSVVGKDTKVVESLAIGKKQSKGQYGSLSIIIEGREDEENVIRSGLDASEDELDKVTFGGPKSTKQRGTPIIEDQIIETEHGSLDKSPQSSLRGTSKSKGKSIARMQVESGSKKPVSRMNIQSSLENASKGKNLAIRSGAIISGSSSKKSAKLGGRKQSDSGDRDENSSKEWTPVAKMGNFQLDKEFTEPEVTLAINKSDRRSTRSTIRSERKVPSQTVIKEQRFTRSILRSERKEPSRSANKEQPITKAHISSLKIAKFQPDPSVNTAPGRITRRSIKHGEYAVSSFSEKVVKKQTSQSAFKEQPLDDAHLAFSPEVAKAGPVGSLGVCSEVKQPLDEVLMSSPEVAKVVPNPDVGAIGALFEITQPLDEVQMPSPEVAEVESNAGGDTIGVRSEVVKMCSPEVAEVRPDQDSDIVRAGSEISKEETSQILGDLSASESVRLPSKVMEENIVSFSETSMDRENVSLASGEKVSGEVMEDAGVLINKLACEASATPYLAKIFFRGKQQNPLELESFDDETPLGKDLSHNKMTSVSTADESHVISDGSHVHGQNEAYVESGTFSEAVNMEISVLKSGKPEAKEKETEMTESGSTLKGLQTDVMIEEPLVSVGKVAVVEGVSISSLGVATKGNNDDAEDNCDLISYDVGFSPLCHSSIQQSDVNTKSMLSARGGKMGWSGPVQISSIDRLAVADDGEQYNEDESASAQKPLMSDPDSEDKNVAYEIDVQENPFSGKDMYDDCDNAISDQKSVLDMFVTPLLGKDDVPGDSSEQSNAYKEIEAVSEQSNACRTLEVPVLGNDVVIECVTEDNSDVQDEEPEHVQLTNNNSHATDEEDVGRDDLEPAQNVCMPVATEVLVRSCDREPEQILNVTIDDVPCDTVGQSDPVMSKDEPKTHVTSGIDDMVVRVDAPKELGLDINKDVVYSILGDTYDTDAEDDSGNEQKSTEVDKGSQPKESGDISSDISDKQMKEVAETSRGNDHTIDEQEQAAATDDLDFDSGKHVEDRSHIGPNDVDFELVENIKTHGNIIGEENSPVSCTKEEFTVDGIDSSQLIGDIGDHGSPITKESLPITCNMEESPVDDPDSDLPTVQEDDRNKQEETRNAGTSVDWGDYDFGMDELEKPLSANRSAEVVGEDDQDLDLQTSASGLAASLSTSVRNLERDSTKAVDGKSKQDVDMLKESADAADMTEEVFDWSDSAMRSLFATSVVTRSSNVKDSQDDAVDLANLDAYSSLKLLHATPATSRVSNVNDSKSSAVNTVSFSYTYGRCDEDMGTSGTVAHEFNHQWENDQSKAFDSETETQGNAVQGPESEMYGVPSFEDYPVKLFGDEEVDGSADDRSERNTHFEFKQFDFLSEAAGTSHHDSSGLKDDSIHSREYEKKEAGTSHHDPSGLEDDSIHSREYEKKEETSLKGSDWR